MRKPIGTFIAAAALSLLAATPAGAHLVQPGETLWSIAQANGVSVGSLAATNGLGAETHVIAGTTLAIPGAATSTTTTSTTGTGSTSTGGRVVQPGESLWSIAQANGVSVASLAAANGLSQNALLVAGRSLAIPGAGSGVSAGTTGSQTATYAANPQPTNVRLSAGEVGNVGQQVGMSRSLVQAIGWQESGFNNAAYSSADARGVMQIIPSTWNFINTQLAGGTLDPNSATDNVRAGSLYLRYLYRLKGGDRDATIGSYYQGPGRTTVLPETQRYVTSVLGFKNWFAANGK